MDRDELLATARAERESLGRTIQYANPERWDDPSACEGWRNRDVVAHLAASDAGGALLIAGEAWPEADEHPEFDGFNDWAVARRTDLPFRQIVGDWGAAADALLVNASKVDVDDWSERTFTYFGDEWTVSDFVQMCVGEWWGHGEDIRSGVELAPRVEHRPIWAVNDLAIRLLPRTLAETGRDYLGHSARFNLPGCGGGTWHVRLSAGPVPDDHKRPDVSIEAEAHAFALVAGRRISADMLIDNGQMLLGGNEEIAYDILENIRPYV
ncbi:MAG: maleylpyruvate isomerase family mycothiol-dependent enzyme [Actinomycetota bacterium]